MLGMVSEADIILQDADFHFPYYIQFLESVIYLQSLDKFEERFRKAFGTKVSEVMSDRARADRVRRFRATKRPPSWPTTRWTGFR